MRNQILKSLIFIFAFVLSIHAAKGQTAGNIFSPNNLSNVVTALDPDSDGNIVDGGSSFSTGSNEFSQFEGEWTRGFQLASEPSGDNSSGGSCSATDVVDDGSNQDAYFIGIYDPDGYPTDESGNEYFLCRLRIGKDPGSAQFGYSILIDTDQKYGSGTDPNAVTGNQGFEIEIRLANGSGSKGIFVDDVDSTTSGTTVASYGFNSHHIKSYALNTSSGCTNQAVFVDMAIPYADLTTYFGIQPSTPIRIAAATSSNGSTVLSSNGSDIAGLDDGAYTDQAAALNDLVTSQSGTALPVELISFKGESLPDKNRLKWATASETNNDYFEVQVKKRSDEKFETVGKVEGNGTSLRTREYNFDHFNPSSGINYYRLKQVDFDGSHEYSKVIVLDQKETREPLSFQLQENPVKQGNKVKVKMNSSDSTPIHLKLLDMAGRKQFEKTVPLNGDAANSAVPTRNLEKGLYVVVVKHNQQAFMRKLLIH